MTPALRDLGGDELFDWLRLMRTDTIGPRTFQTLLARYGSAGEALRALPRLPSGRALTLADPKTIEAELSAAERGGLRFVPACSPAYPPSLRVIASAPPLLTVRGRLDILQRSMVAIVGSRNASANGLVFTDRLARGLGRAGHAVVSGLARGIDARAHGASLESGTVAVLAGGHNRIYPGEHQDLATRIAETGAVLSEMPIDWEPRGRDFPRRNRIVSGLALGVVVVEAARRSGSLITARFGNEQGREIFAVPGSPFDPRAEGTNDLLRGGASFCTSVEDVTSVLAPMVAGHPMLTAREPDGEDGHAYWDEWQLEGVEPGSTRPDADRRRSDVAAAMHDSRPAPDRPLTARECLDGLIGPSPVAIDDLVRASSLPVQEVHAAIIELELDGHIRRQGSNEVARADLARLPSGLRLTNLPGKRPGRTRALGTLPQQRLRFEPHHVEKIAEQAVIGMVRHRSELDAHGVDVLGDLLALRSLRRRGNGWTCPLHYSRARHDDTIRGSSTHAQTACV